MEIFMCNCGAITLDDKSGERKAVYLSRVREFSGLDITEQDLESAVKLWGCDHCCNHRGLDLCKCGSGETTEDCECGCREPSVVWGVKTRRSLYVF